LLVVVVVVLVLVVVALALMLDMGSSYFLARSRLMSAGVGG
jgi:hypothetical protein